MHIFDANAGAATFTVHLTCMGGSRERVSSSAGYIYRDSFEIVIAEGPKKDRCLFCAAVASTPTLLHFGRCQCQWVLARLV